MRPKRRIYPVFLAHAGCPFRCVYCDQRAVTATETSEGLWPRFETQLRRLVCEVQTQGVPGELAFFGGTFTALPRGQLERVLNEASRWVGSGHFTGIRFSTRPDCLDTATARFLDDYPVQTVELGVQSFCDRVLSRSRRGYDSRVIQEAVSVARRRDWDLGLQLMVGLPGDTRQHFLGSVSRAIALRPRFLRLYPTLVLERTVLARWYREGRYAPLDLETAVDWCASGYERCLHSGVNVARMGLHADPVLETPGTVVAGAYHPAFGYLVRSRRWRDRIDEALSGKGGAEKLVLRVCDRSLSEVLGPGRRNVEHWRNRWGIGSLEIEAVADWGVHEFQLA